MTKIINKQDDNDFFNIFEFILMLYKNKFTILIFVFIGSLFTIYFYNESNTYKSNINISINNKPPFSQERNIYDHLERLFYLEVEFKKWNKNHKSTINFNHIRNNFEKDGHVLNKDKNNLMVDFTQGKENNFLANLNISNIRQASDIFNYLNYLNTVINDEFYIRSLKEEKLLQNSRGSISKNVKENSNSTNMTQIMDGRFESLLKTKRFISNYQKKRMVFVIKPPSTLVKPGLIILEFIPLFMSILFSIIFIIFKTGFQNHIKRKQSS